jgi:hypothetical protein
VRLPDAGVLRPSTPPPDFDLELAVTSMRKFAGRRAAGIALAHYGLVPDHETILEEAEDTLQRWAAVAERAWHDGQDIAQALSESFASAADDVAPDVRERMETLNGIHSNAAGFQRWLDTRPAAEPG